MKMTYKQKRAFINVRRRWANILHVETAIGGDCIMVHVQGESGATMWLGIEKDGYTHA
jgi:hypothetical protein